MRNLSLFFFSIAIYSCCPRPTNIAINNLKKDKGLSAIKTYHNFKSALKKPNKVIILDLSGQGLKEVPKSIEKFVNLEVLDLGDRPKNILFKNPRLRFRYCKVGGGLRHFDRRSGKYIVYNDIISLPKEIFNLKKLKSIRLTGNFGLSKKTIEEIKTKGIRVF